MDDTELLALATSLGESLKQRQYRLATAESCTGGWVAKVITDVPGSSHWYERGFVTYTNLAKQQMLGVSASTLEQYGAVSEATVREMAEGALARSEAELAVAISGIAGPGGGSEEKPVGMVCLAWTGPVGVKLETFHFSGDREAVRRQAVQRALSGLQEQLQDG
ncbi:MAG: nicotinamide-nucleotide amidase [Gammaproteobacteria bacterium]|nr:nicotinamide-nucleotide amidase [Gammaproteobacteria bacterium]